MVKKRKKGLFESTRVLFLPVSAIAPNPNQPRQTFSQDGLEELAASPAEFDSIWSASMEIGQSDQPVWFARGFRLGARLMLEALGEGEVFHR